MSQLPGFSKAFTALASTRCFPCCLTTLSIHLGRHTSFAWFASGLRTLDDVRARKGGLKLSTAQEIGLKFYDGGQHHLSKLLVLDASLL